MLKNLNIATRCSPLALWQANHIKERLQERYPNLSVNLVKLTTKGDKLINSPLSKIGGKALFVKELEEALYDIRADIAVHSLKDVPVNLPSGLFIGAYCTRASASDAFVSNNYKSLSELPKGAIIGTSSLRRQCQIKAYRTDLTIKTLRGNVNTRLAKLDAGNYDAIILATSGLQRINLSHRIKEEIDFEVCLPAVGQGALAIECRLADQEVLKLIEPLNNPLSHICLGAERALNRHLQGGCQVPIAAFASTEKNKVDNDEDSCTLALRGRVGSANGDTLLKAENRTLLSGSQTNKISQAEALGVTVAESLLDQGAGSILDKIYNL